MKQPPAPKFNLVEATKQPETATPAPVKAPLNITMRVAEKGGLSVYGLQRMPITLYAEQWINVLDLKDEILAFIEKERTKLAWKETK